MPQIRLFGGLNGNDLIRVVRHKHPGVAVIAATASVVEVKVDGILRKPFLPTKLAALLKSLLDKVQAPISDEEVRLKASATETKVGSESPKV